ncbi:hypothetical protein M0804_015466 [Polistes exclamans]|nr:hypothetical protein M0804_015466 [Polistes exclamans]
MQKYGLMKGLIYQPNYDFSYYRLDKQYNIFEPLYFRPWVRIGPYLKTIILFWILCSLCNLIVHLGLYQTRMSVFAAVFFVALGRNVWAIGIAWVIIACCTDNGGINKYWI